jgi:hypothetical protein
LLIRRGALPVNGRNSRSPARLLAAIGDGLVEAATTDLDHVYPDDPGVHSLPAVRDA